MKRSILRDDRSETILKAQKLLCFAHFLAETLSIAFQVFDFAPKLLQAALQETEFSTFFLQWFGSIFHKLLETFCCRYSTKLLTQKSVIPIMIRTVFAVACLFQAIAEVSAFLFEIPHFQ